MKNCFNSYVKKIIGLIITGQNSLKLHAATTSIIMFKFKCRLISYIKTNTGKNTVACWVLIASYTE